jgi:cobalt/nickel transport system ATP-binding protein
VVLPAPFGPLNLGATPDDARRVAAESLESVGLKDCAERSPHKLSGGEKRRAALAGVLAMKPGVLLLDEPSMFLDPRGRRELIRTVCELPGTLLLATHDLDMVHDCCPRTIVLDGGQVMADGPTSELLANEQLMTTHGLEVPYRLR